MNLRATDILKAIQKLNPAEKHRLREYLIDALSASSSTGTVLQEIADMGIVITGLIKWKQEEK